MDKNDYYYEVMFQVWMRGGNPDSVSYDRAEQNYYNQVDPDDAASAEMRHMRSDSYYPEPDYPEPNYPEPDYPEPDEPEQN